MLDALSLVEEEEVRGDYTWYKIAPGIMYLETTQIMCAEGKLTGEQGLLVITPRDEVPDTRAEERRALMDKVRVYFLQRLIEQHGVGVGLHLTEDYTWRF